MKLFLISLVVVFSCGVAFEPPQSTRVDEGLAVPTRIKGKLECSEAEGGEWRALSENAEVLSGTTLRTGSDDSAFLALAEGGELFLEPDSELKFEGNRMVLKRGALKYRGEEKPETMYFETPDYRIEFSGEQLEVEYLETETHCAILVGLATLRPLVNGASVVNAGNGIQGIGGNDGLWFFEPVDWTPKSRKWEQIGWAIASPSAPAPSSEQAETQSPLPVENMSRQENPVEQLPESKPQPPRPIELPRDGSVPVLMLDSSGGYVLPRRSEEPELVIFADGRAIITDPAGRLPQVTRRLKKENLEEFLSFVVNDHHFYDLTTEGLAELEAQARAQSGGQEITDLSTTILRLGLGNKTIEVRFRGAEFWAEKHPDIQQFRDFQAIEARLRKFIEQSREWAKQSKQAP
jgi:hypothetical protein